MIDRIQDIENELAEAKRELAQASTLRNLTPQEAVNYIEKNMNSLAEAKAVLKVIVRILIVLLNRDRHLRE